MTIPTRSSRRSFVRTCLALPAMLVLAACGLRTEPEAEPTAGSGVASGGGTPPTDAPPAAAPVTPEVATEVATEAATEAATEVATEAATGSTQAASLPPTPACGDDDDEPTPPQTEGPYFTPNSPERASLVEPGMAGTPLTVAGTVLTTDCRPVAGALLDFWHADDSGAYDNAGYRLRGHQFTGADGRYSLDTIMPGLYTGRTPHIHVKVQAPNQPVLTTQLYFPDMPSNASDGIFDPALVMALQDAGAGKAGDFDFVLDVSGS
jgi:protocatechuate 3,4-dioxygenase beta subunit